MRKVVLRFDLMWSGWVFDGETEGGSLSQEEGPKTPEKEREPTVESLERGILRLKVSDI